MSGGRRNTSGEKGTKGEVAVVKWFTQHGFAGADRLTKRGIHDRGDVSLCPGLMVEVKNVAAAAQRGPTPADLAAWMEETRKETKAGGWDLGFLIVKRGGTADVGRWWAYVDAATLAALVVVGGKGIWPADVIADLLPYRAPVCLDVASLTAILRTAGWGDEL